MKSFQGISFLFALALLASVTGFAQNFEGKIVYRNSYKTSMPGVTTEQFTAMMGDQQEFFIKGGNYKSLMNGSMMQWQLYRVEDNRLYFKMSNAPTVFWRDASENPDEVQKAEINKGVETILGKLCDELVLTCKSGVQRYYFSSSVKVDPAAFEKHKFGNWSEVIARTKALPLKFLIDNPQFTIESTATELKAENVDSKQFDLPANAELQKSPY